MRDPLLDVLEPSLPKNCGHCGAAIEKLFRDGRLYSLPCNCGSLPTETSFLGPMLKPPAPSLSPAYA